MSFVVEDRLPDSPYIASIMHGHTAGEGSLIRPAEVHWHMVLRKLNGKVDLLIVGPKTSSGMVTYTEGVELLWIKFKLGTFIPHMPARASLDVETPLPGAASQSFWLHGSAWQFPTYENVETFVDRLVRDGVLVHDPVVDAVLQGHEQSMSPRTVRHRFLRSTGLTQNHIGQFERAQRAASLLQQGFSILDTVFEVGYYDQPHLTRSLKRYVGHTPAQMAHASSAVEQVEA